MTVVLMILLLSFVATAEANVVREHLAVDGAGGDEDAPQPLPRNPFVNDMMAFIGYFDTSTVDVIREVIHVVKTRLNYAHGDGKKITNCLMKTVINNSDIWNDQRFFFKFCDSLLNAVLFGVSPSPVELRGNNQQMNGPCVHIQWPNVSYLTTKLREVYVRDVKLSFRSYTSSMKYMAEAHANRLLCVNHQTINRDLKHIQRDFGPHQTSPIRHLVSTIVINYILRGYNFILGDEVCPIEFIRDIFHRYMEPDNNLADKNLEVLLNDLVHIERNIHSRQEHANCHHNQHQPHPDHNSQHQKNGQQSHSDHNNQHPINGQPFHNNPPEPHGNMHYAISLFNAHLPGYVDTFNSTGIQKNFSASDLIQIFTSKHHRPLPCYKDGTAEMGLFMDMCPAILQQVMYHRGLPDHVTTPDSHINVNTTDETVRRVEKLSTFKSYLYGSFAVLIISLCSLLGAVFMKVSRADIKAYLMGSMMSLAVGCLVSDAMLHLVPEILIKEDTDDDSVIPEHIQKMCALLASVYAFFVLELVLSARNTCTHSHDADVSNVREIQLKYIKPLKETNLNNLNNQLQNVDSGASSKSSNSPNERNTDINVYETDNWNRNIDQPRDLQRTVSKVSSSSDKHSNHGDAKDLRALAWMIIIGDGIHNFADGLAIGAAFSLNFTKGLSTSITVLCHEVPHELGDFAVLVSTGLSIKRAMLLNFLSSLTAFAGLYTGLALGAQLPATTWIFSVGAGMFLYVALTDLIPECKGYYKRTPTIKMFLGENVGIITGYVAMLLLALYEDKLEIKT